MSRATRELRRAQQELAEAIAALIEPGKRKIVREKVDPDGRKTRVEERVTTEPLLTQLQDAVAGSLHVGLGGRRGTPIPIDPGAVDLLAAITRQITTMHVRVLTRSELGAESRLRAVRELTASWADSDQVAAVRDQVQLWADSIRAHLEPATVTPVGKRCPHCRANMVQVYDRSIREYVQDHALVVDHTDGVVTCRGCASEWPWEFAARLIAWVEREEMLVEYYRRHCAMILKYWEWRAASAAGADSRRVEQDRADQPAS